MTIRKGSGYGEPAAAHERPDVVAAGDSEARRALEAARAESRPFPLLGLTGGDLCRTLGGTGDLDTAFPVDLGEVLLDGRLRLFTAHLVVRTRTWSYAFVAMNAQWRGDWNLGPKAHPGDGLLDTYEARLPPGERLKVRRRLHHGAHLPHPGIKERRTAAIQVELPRSLPIVLDGEDVGTARRLSLRARPDAVRVIV